MSGDLAYLSKIAVEKEKLVSLLRIKEETSGERINAEALLRELIDSELSRIKAHSELSRVNVRSVEPKSSLGKNIDTFFSTELSKLPIGKRGRKLSDIYEAYCVYCSDNHIFVESNRKLKSRLIELGITIRISTGKQFYVYGYDLSVVPDEDEDW